jgi:S1-C subfamily serine protease
MAGDTIVAVNDVRLDGGGGKKPLHALGEAMAPVQAGDTVSVTYVRDGETREAEVMTFARGKYMARVVEEKGPWLDSLRSLGDLEDLEALQGLENLQVLEDVDNALSDVIVRAPEGLRLENVSGPLAGYFDVDAGVLVMEVPDRQTALVPGDVLLSVDGEPVSDARSALRRMAALDGEVPATVRREGTNVDVELDAATLNERQALHVFRSDRRIRIQRGGDGEAVRLEIVVKED